MASDVMRVRLHLRQIRLLAVASDTPSELRVEVESTVRRAALPGVRVRLRAGSAACGFGCVRVHDTRRCKVRRSGGGGALDDAGVAPAPVCVRQLRQPPS